jgi:hypothetical protein
VPHRRLPPAVRVETGYPPGARLHERASLRGAGDAGNAQTARSARRMARTGLLLQPGVESEAGGGVTRGAPLSHPDGL